MRTALVAVTFSALVVAGPGACGSSDDPAPTDVSADTSAPVDTASPPDTAGPADTSVAPDTGAPADTEPAADTSAPPSFEVPAPTHLGGDARPAQVIVPAGYDGLTALPAVILLGGYWWYAWELDDWIDLSGRVDARGFVLVLPDGTEDEDGAPFWNATDTCCDFYGSGVDDVAYLTGLLDELTARVNVDPARVSLVGHSNGGFMAYRMACELPERVASVVSVAGSGFLSEAACGADAPVSILQVHGLEDDVMPFEGDSDAPGALTMTARWGARAGCDAASWAAEAERLELVDDDEVDETEVSRFATGCAAGVDVALWALTGSDHYPELRPAFTDRALDWILAHPRPR